MARRTGRSTLPATQLLATARRSVRQRQPLDKAELSTDHYADHAGNDKKEPSYRRGPADFYPNPLFQGQRAQPRLFGLVVCVLIGLIRHPAHTHFPFNILRYFSTLGARARLGALEAHFVGSLSLQRSDTENLATCRRFSRGTAGDLKGRPD